MSWMIPYNTFVAVLMLWITQSKEDKRYHGMLRGR